VSAGPVSSEVAHAHVGMPDSAELLERVTSQLEQDLAVLVPWLQRGERRIKDEEGEWCPVVLWNVSRSIARPSLPKRSADRRSHSLTENSRSRLQCHCTSREPRPGLTFLTASLSSQIELPASIPGIRSPIVKGKDTPVELSTEVVMDLR
jgi:hypothetical protein